MKVWIFPSIAPIEERTYHKDKATCSYWLYDEVADILTKDNEDGKARVLLSAGLWSTGKMNDFKFDRRGKPYVIMADSAGFQFYNEFITRKREFYEARESYYRWQVQEGQIVLAGDIPPQKSVLDNEKLRELIDITKRNIDFQFGLDGDLGSRFLNILHGVGIGGMREWFGAVKGYPGIGYAIGAKFNNVLLGAALQYLFLVENNGLKRGDILHAFAMTGTTILLPLIWLVQKTRPDLIFSTDSSSYSLIRFGQTYSEDGSKVSFDDIRKGKVKVTLYDGSVLTDFPDKTDSVLGKQLELTGLKNFTVNLRKDVNAFLAGDKKYDRLIVDSKIRKYYKIWQTGGVDMLYEMNRSQVIEQGSRLC